MNYWIIFYYKYADFPFKMKFSMSTTQIVFPLHFLPLQQLENCKVKPWTNTTITKRQGEQKNVG